MIDLRDTYLSLLDFVPESIASDPDIIALCIALDPELRDVSQSIVEAIILPRISEVPEWVLDELAWTHRLDRLQVWDSATVDGKRAILADIFNIRKRSGTRYALERVFSLLSVTGSIVEWFDDSPVAAAYTYRYRITVVDVGITKDQLVQLGELTYRFAPASRKLSEFAVESEKGGGVGPAVVTLDGRLVEISYGGPPEP